MSSQRIINTPRSADLATCTILIEGSELPRTCHVMSIVVEKELNRIPVARFTLLDGDPAAQDFDLSNQDLLIPGKEVEIKAGYHSDEATIFKGIVVKHSIKIRSSQSFLIVECRDKSVKLTIGRKSKYFYNSPDSDIMDEITGSYGLENDIETTSVVHPAMVQYNVSDWDFVISRAQASGKVCVVDDGKIAIKKPEVNQDEVETVEFGATLLDFDAEMDARNQFQKITAYGWDAAGQDLVLTEANDPQVNLNGNLAPSDLSPVINLENLELKNGGKDSAVLQDWADAKALFAQLAKVRGRLKFQGIAAVKPGKILKIGGVGERFNGKVYISGVRHQISEGNWTVDAQFGIDPKWFTETVHISDLPAAGLLAAVKGLQIGIVTQLESDPDGEDRILVRLPMIETNGEGTWARVATMDAGVERGSFFRPEIGDEVIVGFINQNPNEAIVLGMMNSSAKPAPITATDANHEKGFVTRSKIKFIFNDEKKSATLETPGGKKITVDDDAGIVKLEDENNNSIVMDSGGITLESASDITIKASGDINIEGMNVTAKANTQMKVEGLAGVEVSSSATAVLKGSLVQIN
jgi:Rhs element Vgr protein